MSTRAAAVLSDDEVYRYELTRVWGDVEDPWACWVMLNPSTADAVADDPTIRRCMAFSEAWGFAGMVVVNLFALRATDPKALLTSGVDAIGERNDHAIRMGTLQGDKTIAAWGTKGTLNNRAATVIQIITGEMRENLYALDVTKDGHPKHPLYVKGDTKPVLYRPAQSGGIGSNQIGDSE